jgi:hypothetical protein
MPDTPGEHVFSLNSALGVALFGDSPPEALNLLASQTCFAQSGTYADTQNLSQRWRSQAGNVYGSHEPIFMHLDFSAQQVIDPTAGELVVAQPGGYVPAGLDTAHGQVYAHSDPLQSDIQSPSDIRYHLFISLGPSHVIYDYIPCRQIGVVPSHRELQNTPSMTPSSVNSTLASLSNITPLFPVQFDEDLSLHSPFRASIPSNIGTLQVCRMKNLRAFPLSLLHLPQSTSHLMKKWNHRAILFHRHLKMLQWRESQSHKRFAWVIKECVQCNRQSLATTSPSRNEAIPPVLVSQNDS